MKSVCKKLNETEALKFENCFSHKMLNSNERDEESFWHFVNKCLLII